MFGPIKDKFGKLPCTLPLWAVSASNHDFSIRKMIDDFGDRREDKHGQARDIYGHHGQAKKNDDERRTGF